jgi:hypothetical protein
VTAPTLPAITVDGNGCEWDGVTESLFVGSLTQAQMSVRFAKCEAGLGILIDRLDNDMTSEDGASIKISLPDNNLSYIEVTVLADGTVKATSAADGKNSTLQVEAASTVFGTLNDDSDTDEGMLTEILIPAEYVPESFSVFPTLINKDTGKPAKQDTIDNLHSSNNSKWIPVR